MNIENHITEIQDAYRSRQSRACFGSLIRRNIQHILSMSSKDKSEWIRDLGLPASYTTEIAKELAVFNYDKNRK